MTARMPNSTKLDRFVDVHSDAIADSICSAPSSPSNPDICSASSPAAASFPTNAPATPTPTARREPARAMRSGPGQRSVAWRDLRRTGLPPQSAHRDPPGRVLEDSGFARSRLDGSASRIHSGSQRGCHPSSSSSLGRQVLSIQACSGPYMRRATNQLLPEMVWSQLCS